MSLKKLLRPTNNRVRLMVGLGLLALVCVQCTKSSEAFKESQLVTSVAGQQVGVVSDPMATRIENMAKNDPVALLKFCLDNYDATIRDYRCTFLKQERIHGTTGAEQEVQVKFLDKPFSVVMQWVRNAPIGDRALYIEGKNDNMMLVHPRGALGKLLGTVKKAPDSPEAMANTLRPITQFGFKRGLQALLVVYEKAAQRGDLKSTFLGYATVAGRRTLVLERTLPPNDDYPAARTMTYIDAQLLVPISVEAWDWEGVQISRYTFDNVQINVGLTEADFTPQANGL